MGTLENSKIVEMKENHGAVDHLRTKMLIEGRKILIFRNSELRNLEQFLNVSIFNEYSSKH